jgi:hypothetical protein
MQIIPTIQIRQTYAKIGIDADHAQLNQRQPKAGIDMKQVSAALSIEQPQGDLTIDQSKAWDALARAGVMEVMTRIRGNAQSVFLDNLAARVERGNRLARIHTGENAIAENAKNITFTFPEFNFSGYASPNNVDIDYTINRPIINIHQGGVDLNVQVNRPELNVQRGKLDIYMRQYGNVEITPPAIDARI